jgi:hypothetical protein
MKVPEKDLAFDLENTVYRKKNNLLMITFTYFSTYLFYVRHAYTGLLSYFLFTRLVYGPVVFLHEY